MKTELVCGSEISPTLSETVIMNKINSIFMQMCHEGCQSVKENLLPVSDTQDKQLQEKKEKKTKKNLAREKK